MKKLLLLLPIVLSLISCSKDVISTELEAGYDIVKVDSEWFDEGCILNENDEKNIEMYVKSNNVDTSTIGDYEVVYSLAYGSENYTCLRIIKVIDDEAPTITLNAGIDTIIKGEEWIDTGVTVFDNYDFDVTVEMIGIVSNNIVGTYVITYTATDNSGNSKSIERIINVIN
jgi:hypothetical protein